jgi:hypothetical protein
MAFPMENSHFERYGGWPSPSPPPGHPPKRQFVYKPLSNPNTIRVLSKIYNGPHNYRLSEIDIGMVPYYALSYTWGSEVERITTTLSSGFLNPCDFDITPTLCSALDNFFTQVAHAFLWVDAICINQDDLEERDQQVRRMKTIYQHAEKMYIYLGDTANTAHRGLPGGIVELDDDHSEQCESAVKLIKYLCGVSQLSQIDWGVTLNLAPHNLYLGMSSDPVITNPKVWHLIRSLFQDAWFERLCKCEI